MSDGANDALLLKAWKARNVLYEDLFGIHVFSLPKRYTPPSGSSIDFRNNDSREPVAGDLENFSATDAVNPEAPLDSGLPGNCHATAAATSGQKAADETNASHAVGEQSAADMQRIRELIASFSNPQINSKSVTVLVYEPSESRPYWLYITAGLSNPWYQDEPSDVSGFGCELMIKTRKPARWPIRLLRHLAFYLFSYSGTLSPGVILNLKEPISGGVAGSTPLDNLFIWYADEAPDCWYQLPSGGFGVFCVVGIAEDECRFAESINEYGTWCIQQVLRQTGIGQITDPQRQSVMHRDGIGGVLSSVRMYAENFRPATL